MANNHKNSHRRKQQYQQGTEQAVIETILKGLWLLISLPFRRANKQKKGNLPIGIAQQLAAHWPSIEMHLQMPATYALAVSEADKLFDAALQAAMVPGNSMGERLQAAKTRFPSHLYQQIWDAHKLRNTLAHEVGVTPSWEQTTQALHTFKNALLQLGVLV
jgi:hypothetical protein